MSHHPIVALLLGALAGNSHGIYIITQRHARDEPTLVGAYIKQKLTHTWSKRSKKRISTKRTSPARKLTSKMRTPTMRKTATFQKK